jgi:hypothetical protein
MRARTIVRLYAHDPALLDAAVKPHQYSLGLVHFGPPPRGLQEGPRRGILMFPASLFACRVPMNRTAPALSLGPFLFLAFAGLRITLANLHRLMMETMGGQEYPVDKSVGHILNVRNLRLMSQKCPKTGSGHFWDINYRGDGLWAFPPREAQPAFLARGVLDAQF